MEAIEHDNIWRCQEISEDQNKVSPPVKSFEEVPMGKKKTKKEVDDYWYVFSASLLHLCIQHHHNYKYMQYAPVGTMSSNKTRKSRARKPSLDLTANSNRSNR